MTRTEMIAFIKKHPYVKITHSLFSDDEYIFSKEDGNVYEEHGYLFENWDSATNMWSGANGIRMRVDDVWQDGWQIKDPRECCKYHLTIPTVGLCCEAYYKSKRNDGKEWMHFPFCSEENCPLKHPELLNGSTLEGEV